MPKVSVYIPLYNRAQTIGKAIEGILQQSFKDFELIIIDDGSTDHSIDVVNQYEDKRIKLYQNNQNRGVVYTRNRAFELANGEYLAINDSDDYSLPNRLAKQVAVLDSNKRIGILGGKAKRIDHLGNKTIWEYPNESENIKCRLFWGSAMINSTLMMRLKMLNNNGLKYDKNFPVAEDYDLFERAQSYFDLQNLDEILVEYYSHPNNLTNTQNELMVKRAYEIHKRQLVKLGIMLTPEESEIWYNLFRYSFCFNKNMLKIILNTGEKILTQNETKKIYSSEIFYTQLGQRLYECFYHSHVVGSYAMFTKSSFSKILDHTKKEKIKFFLSQYR